MALWRSTFIVSAMTMLSRVLGLVRDVVLLNVFGAGKDFDTFVVAFRIPNFSGVCLLKVHSRRPLFQF